MNKQALSNLLGERTADYIAGRYNPSTLKGLSERQIRSMPVDTDKLLNFIQALKDDTNTKTASTPEEAYQCVKHIGSYAYEVFVIVILDTKNEVLGVEEVSSGDTDRTLVPMKRIFQTLSTYPTAIRFIVAHNHPSGNLNPSKSDRRITEKIVLAADVMDYDVLDHIVVGNDDFHSFRQNGGMPSVKFSDLI